MSATIGAGSSAVPQTEAEISQAGDTRYVKIIAQYKPQLLINSDFRINQRSYVSTATLAAGVYGHDRWKAGATGGDYSFTQLASSTTITIASGKSLIQVVEDKNVAGGSYVLSWSGTALGRVGINSATPSGAYAASPIQITGQTAGTTMSVEFGPGTLGTVKLELGSVPTPFVMQDYKSELDRAQRYCRFGNPGGLGWSSSTSTILFNINHVGMRAAPSVVALAAIAVFNGSGNLSQSAAGITITGNHADGGMYTFNNFTVTTSTAYQHTIVNAPACLLTSEL